MRLNLNAVNKFLVTELDRRGTIDHVKRNGFDVIEVQLPTGELVAIHLVERDIDVGLIHQLLVNNAKKGMYTLFILWASMLLPENGERYMPYDWMSTLLALYGDHIYGFDNDGVAVWIFPVYFDVLPGRIDRQVRYGQQVNFDILGVETVHTEASHLNGTWRIADFEIHAHAEPTPTGESTSDPAADPASRTPRRPRHPMHRYYEVLGISLDADADEVRRAYRSLAMQFHPDLNDSADATEKMQAINTAYARIIEFLGG